MLGPILLLLSKSGLLGKGLGSGWVWGSHLDSMQSLNTGAGFGAGPPLPSGVSCSNSVLGEGRLKARGTILSRCKVWWWGVLVLSHKGLMAARLLT